MSRLWFGVLIIYLSALIFLSLNPWVRPTDSGGAFSPDKIDHAVAYSGLAIVIYFCFYLSRGPCGCCRPCAWTVAVAGATLAGILIEIVQTLLTANRSGSVEDAVANALGALLGFAVFRVVELLHSRRGVA